MPPRKTTDFGALFAALIEDLRIQVAASVDRSLGDLGKRLARLERRLNELDTNGRPQEDIPALKLCALCSRRSVARGLCSAHYQQWRYRERKTSRVVIDHRHPRQAQKVGNTLILSPAGHDVSRDN